MNGSNAEPLKRKSLIPVYLCFCVFMMGAGGAHPVTPTYIIERGLDKSMQGIAFAATMFTMFLIAPFWGKFCNYIATKKMVLISAIGYSIGQFIFLMAYSNFMMVFARLFSGCFSSATFVALTNYIINTTPDIKERGKSLTIYATVQTVFSAVGYFVGGLLGLISTETTLIAQICFLFFGGFAMHLFMSDDTPFKKAPEKKLAFADVNPLAVFAQAKSFMTPKLVMIFAIFAVAFMAQSCTEQIFNFFIKAHFNLPSSYNGSVKAIIAVGSLTVNSLITMRIMKSPKMANAVLPVHIIMAVPFVLMLFMTEFYPMAALYIFINLMITVRTPLLQNLAAANAKPGTSNTLMGFYQSIGYLGSCIGGLVEGFTYKINEMYPFYVAAAAMIATVIICFIFQKKYINNEE